MAVAEAGADALLAALNTKGPPNVSSMAARAALAVGPICPPLASRVRLVPGPGLAAARAAACCSKPRSRRAQLT